MLLQGPPGEGYLQEEGTEKKGGKERCEPVHKEEGEGEEARGPDPADDPGNPLDPGTPAAGVPPPADETPEKSDWVVSTRRVPENPVNTQGCSED